MHVIYIFYCIYYIFIVSVNAYDACKTPNNLDGTCIPLAQCPSLQSIVSSDQHQTLLSQSVCGNEGIKPYVCCPNKFTELDLPPTGRCGTQAKDRIFGGHATTLQDFPWLALLRYKKPNKRKREIKCGGILIHEYYVLTAAHCTIPRNFRNFVLDSIRLGEHDIRTRIDCIEGSCALPVSDIPIAEIIKHSNFNNNPRTPENDIALIRLSQPAPYTDFIRPICLPLASHLKNKDFKDFPVTVAGFGKTENASSSEEKLKVDILGVDLQTCINVYREYTINTKHLCAGGVEGRNNCYGDSGGPLIAEDSSNTLNTYSYLVGIVSVGPNKCGQNGYPGVYTRVDKYIDWILDHMEHKT